MTSDTSGETMTGVQTVPTTLDILIGARKLIEKPENWLNRAPTGSNRNCAATAIWKTRGSKRDPDLERAGYQAYDALADAMGVKIVADFNDTHTHAEVLAAFDKAIEAERGKQ